MEAKDTKIEYIQYEEMYLPDAETIQNDFGYGKSKEQLDYNIAIRNKPSGGVGNNWAYSFISTNGSATNTTTILPLNGGFNGGGNIINDKINNGIKVNQAGLYYITAQANFGLTNGTRIYARIRINNNSIGLSQYYRYPTTTTIYYYPIHISGIWYLNSGDIITFVRYSDGTLDWVQQDVSNWITGGGHNEQGVMMQVYKV